MGTFGRRHCRFPNINNCRTQIKIIVSKHPVRRLISAVSESEQKGRTFRGLIPLCGVHPPSALPIFRISIGHCFRPIPWASFFLPHRGLCPTIDAFISWLSSFISHHQSVTAARKNAVLPAIIMIHLPKFQNQTICRHCGFLKLVFFRLAHPATLGEIWARSVSYARASINQSLS